MTNRTLYLECYSGISGDMTVAALLDLGADQKVLLAGLKSLNVEGYKVVIGRREKNSIDVCDFDVILDDMEYGFDHDLENSQEHSHNHDPNHVHQHENNQEQEHSHDHNHNHDDSYNHTHTHDHNHTHASDDHSHSHGHNGHSHSHTHDHANETIYSPIQYGHHDHRNLTIINDIIDRSSITDNAKAIAKRIFYIVATAESKAHGKPVEEVHFHEVGAIDSIVDIVAVAICLDNLNIMDVAVSELYEGTGFIRCQHGLLPVPVPGVINIVSEHNLTLHITNVKGELVTPTGAAIVAAIRTREALPKDMKILKVGLGGGKRKYEGASGILRAMLIEDIAASMSDSSIAATSAATSMVGTAVAATASIQETAVSDSIWILEANIDDCTGEALALTMELLFRQGARDVYYTPIFMKKNRPAYLLGALCSKDKIAQMEDIIFINTTTIGIRRHEAFRTMLDRKMETVTTDYGQAQVKVCTYKDRKFFYPEYESIKQLCEISGLDYMTVYQLVQTTAQQSLNHIK